MADQLQKFVAERSSLFEDVMEVFEKGAEIAMEFVDVCPVFAIAAPIVKLYLDNVESKETVFIKEQFQKLKNRLDVISEENQRVIDALKKKEVDLRYFTAEENISNQFLMFMDILKAKPKYREVKKEEFLGHFVVTGDEDNLETLYNAVTIKSILEVILNYEEKSRRVVEDFCFRLKQLFCIGVIALIAHTALKGDDAKVEKLTKKWSENMKDVQTKMSAVIEECIVSFPKQAKLDSRRLVEDHDAALTNQQRVRDHSVLTNQQLADDIIEKLKKKYDWVGWSVRIWSPSKSLLSSKQKDCRLHLGRGFFQVPSSNEKLTIIVSYSDSPQPVDRKHIQRLIQSEKKATLESVAQLLVEKLPNPCMVHTVKTCKDLACSWSFTDEQHYWEFTENKFYVCVHSDHSNEELKKEQAKAIQPN